MKGKTRDGIKLNKILSAVTKVGVDTRQGTNHYLLLYKRLRPCPLATSTDTKNMIVPWIQKITNYESGKIYTALKQGKW